MSTDIINKMGNNNYRQTQLLEWRDIVINPALLVVPLVETVQEAGKGIVKVGTHILNPVSSRDGCGVPVIIERGPLPERAIYVRIRAVWIKHGAFGGTVSALSGPLMGKALTHWYAEIETDNPKVWYWAELNIYSLTLEKCSSREEVNKKGASSGGNKDASSFTTKR